MLERLVDMLGGHGLHVGYAFVFFVLLLCGFGLPMPEDVVLATGGVLAWLASDLERVTVAGMIRDRGLLTMIAVGLGGILAGDTTIVLAGRRFGHRVADIAPLRRNLQREHLRRVQAALVRSATPLPADAMSLLRLHAGRLQTELRTAAARPGLSIETQAHLQDSLNGLSEALRASMQRS